MCMKPENEKFYRCADHLFFGTEKHEDGHKLNLLADVEDYMEATIQKDIAEREFKELLDSWHERGIMKPKK